MNSYKVYLTRSSEVARRIAKSFDINVADILSVSHGMAHEDNELIPAIYGGKGYFYCIVTLAPVESEAPTYELTVC